MKHKPDYITVEEAMKITGLCRRTLERWRELGRITRYKIGTQRIRYERSEVLALLKPTP